MNRKERYEISRNMTWDVFFKEFLRPIIRWASSVFKWLLILSLLGLVFSFLPPFEGNWIVVYVMVLGGLFLLCLLPKLK
ncbi:MAG: hypothetical protein IJW12_01950 [Opitutales bacterium]|nr:hypothetical protein [Opitutales bacterium]